MSNFPRKIERSLRLPKLAEVIAPSSIEFIGEQTDPADAQTKTTLRWVFNQQSPQVFVRAYLARVSFGQPGISSVVLCIRNIDSIEQKLYKGSRHMFGQIHRRGSFYDCMMIDEELERNLKKVCKPFYEAAQPQR
jgi:hypothetical protein